MTEKTCNSCIHFGACSKWTDFPKQCGVPVCASFAQQSEWISVHDRLPEMYEDVLCHNGHSFYIDFICSDGTWCDDEIRNEKITHWMPLPEPPEMKGGAD